MKRVQNRQIKCSLHGGKIHGPGMTRVLSKLVFHFCADCWRNREDCEALMRRVAGIAPEPTIQEVASTARAQAGASAAVCALPASLAGQLDHLPTAEVA